MTEALPPGSPAEQGAPRPPAPERVSPGAADASDPPGPPRPRGLEPLHDTILHPREARDTMALFAYLVNS